MKPRFKKCELQMLAIFVLKKSFRGNIQLASHQFQTLGLTAALVIGVHPKSLPSCLLQARVLERVAMPSSRGSSLPGDRTGV